MGYARSRKEELLEEYWELDARVSAYDADVRMKRYRLRGHEDLLREAVSAVWEGCGTGTPQEQKRLRLALVDLGRRVPVAKELAEKVLAYERASDKEPWRRPKPEVWQRLVNEVRRELRVIWREQSANLDGEWADVDTKVDAMADLRRKRDHLQQVLADEIMEALRSEDW